MKKKYRNRHKFYARIPSTPRPTPDVSAWNGFVEATSEDDRIWFEQHPGTQQRIRDYQVGEFLDQVPPAGYKVLVRQLQPGVRYRSAISPTLVERIEAGAGEWLDLPLESVLREALEGAAN